MPRRQNERASFRVAGSLYQSAEDHLARVTLVYSVLLMCVCVCLCVCVYVCVYVCGCPSVHTPVHVSGATIHHTILIATVVLNIHFAVVIESWASATQASCPSSIKSHYKSTSDVLPRDYWKSVNTDE